MTPRFVRTKEATSDGQVRNIVKFAAEWRNFRLTKPPFPVAFLIDLD
jgi:hypothetical protein